MNNGTKTRIEQIYNQNKKNRTSNPQEGRLPGRLQKYESIARHPWLKKSHIKETEASI